jgi:hypothetical protein
MEIVTFRRLACPRCEGRTFAYPAKARARHGAAVCRACGMVTTITDAAQSTIDRAALELGMLRLAAVKRGPRRRARREKQA